MNTGEYERVYVELERYSGPLSGVADVGGVPHYFHAADPDQVEDRFYVWPIAPEVFVLERECWAIFVRWNERYELGEAGPESHPGVGGIDERYDELEERLKPSREVPADARLLVGRAEFLIDEEVPRYRVEGCDYAMRWSSP
ncbi:MAG TPA: hypothetical protein VGD34_25520 [Kribbella sp.]|jgi:hypothetical protein